MEFNELSDDQRNVFMRDVAKTTKAISKALSPDKINYGAYADTISHLHIHVVPKHKGSYGFGGIFFEKNSQKIPHSDEEYASVIGKINTAL